MAQRNYELSVWEDRKVALGSNGVEYDSVTAAEDAGATVISTYYKETKLLTIASPSMQNSPVRAFNVRLSQKVNGANGVMFSMVDKYWNELTNKFEDNPYLPYLINERKVKLYFKNKWYDLYINSVKENSQSHTYEYECQDAYIKELAKTGTKIVLNTELYNNMGTAPELATTILVDTDWQVAPTDAASGPKSDRLNQFKTEILYQFTTSLPDLINVTEIDLENGTLGQTSSEQIDEHWYVFYSDVNSTIEKVQLIHIKNDATVEKDERGIITNGENFEVARSTIEAYLNSGYLALQKTTFGNRIVRHNRGKYIPQVEQYCKEYYKINEEGLLSSLTVDNTTLYFNNLGDRKVYTNNSYTTAYTGNLGFGDVATITFNAGVASNCHGDSFYFRTTDRVYRLDIDNNGLVNARRVYYGYSQTIYASSDEVKNLINNSSGFNTTKGWTTDVGATTAADNRPIIFVDKDDTYTYLNLGGSTYNDGLFINKNATKTYCKGERVCLISDQGAFYWTAGADYPRFDSIELQYMSDNGQWITFGTLYEYSNGWRSGDGHPFGDNDDDFKAAKYIFDQVNATVNRVDKQVYYGIINESISKARLGDEKYSTTRIKFNAHENAAWTGANSHAWTTDLQLFKVIYSQYTEGGATKRDHIILPATVVPVEPSGENYEPIYGETQFRKGLEYYEYINNSHVLTSDSVFNPTKQYYLKITDPTMSNALYQTRYYFFDSDLTNKPSGAYIIYDSVLNAEDVDQYFKLVDDEEYPFEKISSIEEANSNCFNLIQSVCEKFECWAQFYIEHDSLGNIQYEYKSVEVTADNFNPYIVYYDIDERPIWWPGEPTPTYSDLKYIRVPAKYVIFKEYIGRDNDVGFRYGINLDSITRTLNSDQIVTKLIVQSNSNEFAKNGSCTLQAAALNPTKENTIYTFDYFIQKGLLDQEEVNDDLYGPNGYITQLAAINAPLNELIDETANMLNVISNLQSRLSAYDTVNATITYVSIGDDPYDMTRDYYQKINSALNPTTAGDSEISYELVSITNDIRTNWSTYAPNLYYQELTPTGDVATLAPSYSQEFYKHTQLLLTYYRGQYYAKSRELDEIKARKAQLNQQFYTKYSQFLKEGGWTSEDYYDPDLYYDAALQVAYRSAMPQVTYDIKVAAIEVLPEYEPYEFQIGDKTYIEDIEFFGYDDQGRPYKEEIVVSECQYVLDNPIQDVITVKNYKTQFEELFQRIAASSNTVQFNEGKYDRSVSTSIDNTNVLAETRQVLANNGLSLDTDIMALRVGDKALLDLAIKEGAYAAGLQALIYPNGASTSIFASVQDPVSKEINAASITAAINGSGSTVSINADKIYLQGQTIIDALQTTGGVTISGNNITVGSINGIPIDNTVLRGVSAEGNFNGTVNSRYITVNNSLALNLDEAIGSVYLGNTTYRISIAGFMQLDVNEWYVRVRAEKTSGSTSSGDAIFKIVNGLDQKLGEGIIGLDPEHPTFCYVTINSQPYQALFENNSASITINTQGSITYSGISCNAHFFPALDRTYTLGGAGRLWADIFGVNQLINQSDVREKQNISSLPSQYDTLFDLLSPVKYQWIDNTSERYHIGFIAQEVESALIQANLTTKDFAGLIIGNLDQPYENQTYGLRYGEFIALNTWQIQLLKARVASLEQRIAQLEGTQNVSE